MSYFCCVYNSVVRKDLALHKAPSSITSFSALELGPSLITVINSPMLAGLANSNKKKTSFLVVNCISNS